MVLGSKFFTTEAVVTLDVFGKADGISLGWKGCLVF